MTGLLQDRVAPSKHSRKTDSSCLVEDLALGTLFFSIEAKQGGLGEGFGSHINLCNCSLTSFIQVHAGRWVCRVLAYATHSTYHPQHVPPTAGCTCHPPLSSFWMKCSTSSSSCLPQLAYMGMMFPWVLSFNFCGGGIATTTIGSTVDKLAWQRVLTERRAQCSQVARDTSVS